MNVCVKCFRATVEHHREYIRAITENNPGHAALKARVLAFLDQEAARAKEMPPPPCAHCSPIATEQRPPDRPAPLLKDDGPFIIR